MLTDIEIAESIKLKNINKIAKKLKIKKSNLITFGNFKAKTTHPIKPRNDSKVVLVTAISPSSAGIGKTTVSIGLADALNKLNQSVCLALREPSLGPVFGIKGGATGGGFSQVVPMADINLHFTGDFHAVTSANNLLCSMIDNHIFHGNELDIDENRIMFHRCMDINDRALRDILINKTSKTDYHSETFTITSACEIMAIMCLSKDIDDLKKRLGNILIAFNKSGNAIFARDLKIVDAMTILLKGALLPNLVQTLEGTPAIIHMGPFANIAHGCNSLIATNLSRTLAQYTITEAGFGADLGAEKFFDIKCRIGNIKPNAVVLVATIQALKLQGGMDKNDLKKTSVSATKKGLENLFRHISIIKDTFKLPIVVAINKHSCDTSKELEVVTQALNNKNIPYALNDSWASGGKGAISLAKEVINLCKEDNDFEFCYDLNDTITSKITSIVTKVYGGKDVKFSNQAKDKLKLIKSLGIENYPVIIAKTQYSLSDNPALIGAPKEFTVNITDLEIRSGAGFIVAIADKMMLMPGLSKVPAGTNMTISSEGIIKGLF